MNLFALAFTSGEEIEEEANSVVNVFAVCVRPKESKWPWTS